MTEEKKNEWIKWSITTLIQIILIAVSVVMAYSSLDKRVAIIEAEQHHKVDGEELQKRLKEWKNEIISEIKQIK